MVDSPPEVIEHTHAHDLQLILRATHSLLAYHVPYIKDGRSLRLLDLALLSAIAELQLLSASPPGDNLLGPTHD